MRGVFLRVHVYVDVYVREGVYICARLRRANFEAENSVRSAIPEERKQRGANTHKGDALYHKSGGAVSSVHTFEALPEG